MLIYFYLGNLPWKDYANNEMIKIMKNNIMNDESIPQCTGRILFEKTMNMIMEPYDFEKLINDNKINHNLINYKKY